MGDLLVLSSKPSYCATITGRWHIVPPGAPMALCGYEVRRALETGTVLPAWADDSNLCRVCARKEKGE